MRYNIRKFGQKGSALLIVMLLVTVLTTVALTTGYLTMAEVNMETSSEDGVMAYYAAEAGIEDGLLRYRYDNNVEVGGFNNPLKAIGNIVCGAATSNFDCVERVNMAWATGDPTPANSNNINPGNNPPADNSKQYYDLRIKYKEDNSSSFTSDVIASDKELKKDEAIDFTGFPNGSSIEFKFKAKDSRCTISTCLVEILGAPNGTEIVQLTGTTEISKPISALTPTTNLRVKYWYAVASGIIPSINYKVKAENSSAGIGLDSGYTTIESTGYYGASKRRLQAKIDRKSGKLLEIFDFVLNSTNGNIN